MFPDEDTWSLPLGCVFEFVGVLVGVVPELTWVPEGLELVLELLGVAEEDGISCDDVEDVKLLLEDDVELLIEDDDELLTVLERVLDVELDDNDWVVEELVVDGFGVVVDISNALKREWCKRKQLDQIIYTQLNHRT